jgi:antitoxin MazE
MCILVYTLKGIAMNVTTKPTRWGNGAGVRLSQKVMRAAHLKLNQNLEITIKNNSIILTPVEDDNFTLDDMLEGVTPDKVHSEIEWGKDVGAEVID